MILFYMILLIMLNILLLGSLVWMYFEKEYWVEKYQEQLKQLYPIEWDYTKKEGWREDFDRGS